MFGGHEAHVPLVDPITAIHIQGFDPCLKSKIYLTCGVYQEFKICACVCVCVCFRLSIDYRLEK